MLRQNASPIELLTPSQMAEADRATIASSLPGLILMEHAALAIRDVALERYREATRIAVLAGPGNNGGDAFAAARLLARAGRDVTVYALKPPTALSGDARVAAGAWTGDTWPLHQFEPSGFSLIIDGMFGAGLSRAPDGQSALAIERVNASGLPVIAVDLPSGISGESGAELGGAIQATSTVTFFRLKPGHLLEPGRSRCGEVFCRDIGIPVSVLDAIRPTTFRNDPALWIGTTAFPAETGHKYDRGHAVVFSGGASTTGAARLAARAALRAGAGLVSVFAAGSAMSVNAAQLTAVMLKRCETYEELEEHLQDERLNAFVLGPGFGIGERTRAYAAAVLAAKRRLVLDADGLSSFRDEPEALFAALASATKPEGAEPMLVLTPHFGEFKRLFPDLAGNGNASKLHLARQAARRSGGVVVLKGRDTVIAAPDGRSAINTTGTPWLATAGTGDVLTGMIAARLAQGSPTFEAACAAVWMHGKAAESFGPGLIAEDLPEQLPAVFAALAVPER